MSLISLARFAANRSERLSLTTISASQETMLQSVKSAANAQSTSVASLGPSLLPSMTLFIGNARNAKRMIANMIQVTMIKVNSAAVNHQPEHLSR